MSEPTIEAITGGGWRNRSARPVHCKTIPQSADVPNNDLGFRTFRNSREPVIHERKGET